jgi:hypothetical protein
MLPYNRLAWLHNSSWSHTQHPFSGSIRTYTQNVSLFSASSQVSWILSLLAVWSCPRRAGAEYSLTMRGWYLVGSAHWSREEKKKKLREWKLAYVVRSSQVSLGRLQLSLGRTHRRLDRRCAPVECVNDDLWGGGLIPCGGSGCSGWENGFLLYRLLWELDFGCLEACPVTLMSTTENHALLWSPDLRSSCLKFSTAAHYYWSMHFL